MTLKLKTYWTNKLAKIGIYGVKPSTSGMQQRMPKTTRGGLGLNTSV